MTIIGQCWLLLCRQKIIVHRDDVPERGIHRIKLRLFTVIWEAIRQHALRNCFRPLQQDVARFFEPADRDAQTAQSDKRVASPIAKPRISSDEGLAFAAFDEIHVSGALERAGKILPTGLLDRSDLGMTRFDGFCSRLR